MSNIICKIFRMQINHYHYHYPSSTCRPLVTQGFICVLQPANIIQCFLFCLS